MVEILVIILFMFGIGIVCLSGAFVGYKLSYDRLYTKYKSINEQYELLKVIDNSKSREYYMLCKQYKHLQKLYNNLKKGRE